MTDIVVPSTPSGDIQDDNALNQFFADIQRLNEQIQQDQLDIDRLKAETRVISSHSDRLLAQIEAQLDLLHRAD